MRPSLAKPVLKFLESGIDMRAMIENIVEMASYDIVEDGHICRGRAVG